MYNYNNYSWFKQNAFTLEALVALSCSVSGVIPNGVLIDLLLLLS